MASIYCRSQKLICKQFSACVMKPTTPPPPLTHTNTHIALLCIGLLDTKVRKTFFLEENKFIHIKCLNKHAIFA